MKRSRASHLLQLFLGLGCCTEAQAQSDTNVTIAIDTRASGTPLKSVWSYFGYDEANYTTSLEARELLLTLAVHNSAPVYTRTHFLFNTGDGTPQLKWGSTNIYTEDAEGSPIYDYRIIDEIMDATVRSGALPLFELGFMPEALTTHDGSYENSSTYVIDSGAFYPPSDYEKWGALVRAYAQHVKERYPDAEEAWQWELWNEPDIPYWRGTFEEFTRLYDYTEAALHEVFPDAPLGGPATVRAHESFLADFLEHCASGTNAVTGERGTRLDLVTFHAKGGTTLIDRNVRMDLGNQLLAHRIGFETVAASGTFAQTPIIISEADPDGCAACSSNTALHLAYRNSPAYGAYVVAMMKRSLDLADELNVDLRGVLTWAFTFPETPYFPGYRALSTNGIHLPVLNAFKLLGKLQGRRLPVESSGAVPLEDLLENSVRQSADVDALAAIDGDKIRILVWNYHDDLIPAEASQVSLDLNLPDAFLEGVAVTHQRVDDSHGNAFTTWVAQGSPAAPSEVEVEQLRDAMHGLEFEPERVLLTNEGELSLSFGLPRFGVSLLTLSPATKEQKAALNEQPPSLDPASCYCRTTTPRAPMTSPLFLFLAALAIATAGRRSPTLLKASGLRLKVPSPRRLLN